MQAVGGKRKVSACIPCYTRKQKCNRQYPCNHCTRRRRVEDCNYFTPDAIQQADPAAPPKDNEQHKFDRVGLLSDLNEVKSPMNDLEISSLAELFGYSEDSHTNTLALLQTRRLYYEEGFDDKSHDLSREIVADAQQILHGMPERPVLDFLVRYFVAEVNWIDQLIYVPWFLEQYQLWWASQKHSSVFDLEFAVTILRICSYTSQFLPSKFGVIEMIHGMEPADIRRACDDVADIIAKKCTYVNPKGSLLRVQHLSFAGLKSRCEGRINDFRDNIKRAIQIAQDIGIDKDDTVATSNMGELEKEMRRRVFCNLYIWDSLLSRQLDRNYIYPYCLNPENMPRMHLGPHVEGNKDLDEFTERLLQARLANFWKSARVDCNNGHDLVGAEERYERFCNEYLANLPSAFALKPNMQWDTQFPILAKQRELLHISIFESLCYNFRSTLLQNLRQAQNLPEYKQVLLLTQRRRLAVVALHVLTSASALHVLISGSQTRLPEIIRPTFEAAVLLVNVYLDQSLFEEMSSKRYNPSKIDPLEAGMASLTRGECISAIRDALARLQIMREVSHMAKITAQALSQLLQRTINGSMPVQTGARPSHLANEVSGQSNNNSTNRDLPASSESRRGLLPGTTMASDLEYSDMNWEELNSGL